MARERNFSAFLSHIVGAFGYLYRIRSSRWSAKAALVAVILVTVVLFQNCQEQPYSLRLTQQSVAQLSQSKKTIDDLSMAVGKLVDPLNILFLIDNSYTMSQSQLDLKNAISSLAKPISDMSSRVFITSIDLHLNFIDQFSDPSTGQLLTSSYGNFPSGTKLKIEKTRFYHLPVIPLAISASSTASQKATFEDAITNRIASLGLSGSSTETGMTKLLSIMQIPNSIPWFKSGDRAAIIVITDEDDHSAENPTMLNALWTKASSLAHIERFYSGFEHYKINGYGAQVEVSYVVDLDGVPVSKTKKMIVPPSRVFKAPLDAHERQVCDNTPLTDADWRNLLKFTSEYRSIALMGCSLISLPLRVIQHYADSLDNCPIQTNSLKQFFTRQIGNQSPITIEPVASGLSSYAVQWDGTLGYIFDLDSAIEEHKYHCQTTGRVVPDGPQQTSRAVQEDLEAKLGMKWESSDKKTFVRKALKQRLDALFGADGYHVLMFVMSADCTPGRGQTVGTEWARLAMDLGPQNATLSPICRPADFGPYLSDLAQKTQKLPIRVLSLAGLTANKYQRILKVTQNHKNVKTELSATDYTFNSATQQITISSTKTLEIDDTLEIQAEIAK